MSVMVLALIGRRYRAACITVSWYNMSHIESYELCILTGPEMLQGVLWVQLVYETSSEWNVWWALLELRQIPMDTVFMLASSLARERGCVIWGIPWGQRHLFCWTKWPESLSHFSKRDPLWLNWMQPMRGRPDFSHLQFKLNASLKTEIHPS